MTVANMLSHRRCLAQERWQEYIGDVAAAEAHVRAGDAHSGYWLLMGSVSLDAPLVDLDRIMSVAPAIASVVDAGVAEADAGLSDGPVTVEGVRLMSLGNTAECVGASLSSSTHATILRPDGRVAVPQGDGRLKVTYPDGAIGHMSVEELPE